MKTFKVTIIGNSVALRTRPHRKYQSTNYGQRLEAMLNEATDQNTVCQVVNRAFSRATVEDSLVHLQAHISTFPDVYIINLGVCDAATREIPLWYADVINKPGKGLLKALLSGIHHHLFKPNRRALTLLRGKKTWVSPARFRQEYSRLIKELLHNTNARLICMAINNADARVEEQIPGSTVNYKHYSDIISEVAEENGAAFLDTRDLEASDTHPDGTHFNDQGHQYIAERLLNIIRE